VNRGPAREINEQHTEIVLAAMHMTSRMMDGIGINAALQTFSDEVMTVLEFGRQKPGETKWTQ